MTIDTQANFFAIQASSASTTLEAPITTYAPGNVVADEFVVLEKNGTAYKFLAVVSRTVPSTAVLTNSFADKISLTFANPLVQGATYYVWRVGVLPESTYEDGGEEARQEQIKRLLAAAIPGDSHRELRENLIGMVEKERENGLATLLRRITLVMRDMNRQLKGAFRIFDPDNPEGGFGGEAAILKNNAFVRIDGEGNPQLKTLTEVLEESGLEKRISDNMANIAGNVTALATEKRERKAEVKVERDRIDADRLENVTDLEIDGREIVAKRKDGTPVSKVDLGPQVFGPYTIWRNVDSGVAVLEEQAFVDFEEPDVPGIPNVYGKGTTVGLFDINTFNYFAPSGWTNTPTAPGEGVVQRRRQVLVVEHATKVSFKLFKEYGVHDLEDAVTEAELETIRAELSTSATQLKAIQDRAIEARENIYKDGTETPYQMPDLQKSSTTDKYSDANDDNTATGLLPETVKVYNETVDRRDEAKGHRDAASGFRNQAFQYRNDAEGFRTGSRDARDESREWAEKDEDSPVQSGKFSSKHWAAKAEDSGEDAKAAKRESDASAETARRWAVDENTVKPRTVQNGVLADGVDTGEHSAKTHAENAKEDAGKAKGYADDAKNAKDDSERIEERMDASLAVVERVQTTLQNRDSEACAQPEGKIEEGTVTEVEIEEEDADAVISSTLASSIVSQKTMQSSKNNTTNVSVGTSNLTRGLVLESISSSSTDSTLFSISNSQIRFKKECIVSMTVFNVHTRAHTAYHNSLEVRRITGNNQTEIVALTTVSLGENSGQSESHAYDFSFTAAANGLYIVRFVGGPSTGDLGYRFSMHAHTLELSGGVTGRYKKATSGKGKFTGQRNIPIALAGRANNINNSNTSGSFGRPLFQNRRPMGDLDNDYISIDEIEGQGTRLIIKRQLTLQMTASLTNLSVNGRMRLIAKSAGDLGAQRQINVNVPAGDSRMIINWNIAAGDVGEGRGWIFDLYFIPPSTRVVTAHITNVRLQAIYTDASAAGKLAIDEVCIPTTAVLTEMAGIEKFFGRAADAYNVRFLRDLDLTARVQNYPLAARTQSVILIPKQKVSGKLKPACPFHALYNAILTIRPQNENYHGARVSLVATHYVMIGGVERSFETETPRIFNFSADGGSYQGIANTINLGVFNSINEINIGDDIPGTNGQMQFTAESFEREIDFSLSLKITPARVAGGGSLVDGSFNIEVDGEAFFFQFAPVVTFNPRTSILKPHEHGSVIEYYDLQANVPLTTPTGKRVYIGGIRYRVVNPTNNMPEKNTQPLEFFEDDTAGDLQSERNLGRIETNSRDIIALQKKRDSIKHFDTVPTNPDDFAVGEIILVDHKLYELTEHANSFLFTAETFVLLANNTERRGYANHGGGVFVPVGEVRHDPDDIIDAILQRTVTSRQDNPLRIVWDFAVKTSAIGSALQANDTAEFTVQFQNDDGTDMGAAQAVTATYASIENYTRNGVHRSVFQSTESANFFMHPGDFRVTGIQIKRGSNVLANLTSPTKGFTPIESDDALRNRQALANLQTALVALTTRVTDLERTP